MQDFPIMATPELDDAILSAVTRARPPQMAVEDPERDARAVVAGIAGSESALGATRIVDAIWRVGWPKVRAAIEGVAADVFGMDPGNVECAGGLRAVARLKAEVSLGEPAETARAYVSKGDEGAFFILGEIEEAADTITGRRCIVEVLSSGEDGEWRVADAMESDDADIPDALNAAKSTLLPMSVLPVCDVVMVPVAMADLNAATGRGGQPGVADPAALTRCLAALAERLCSIDDVERDIAALTRDLAPAPWRAEVDLELEDMKGGQRGLAALAEGARSASTARLEPEREIYGDAR